jgi:hypothetical protein
MKMDDFILVSVDDHLVEPRLKKTGTDTVSVLDLAAKLPSSS